MLHWVHIFQVQLEFANSSGMTLIEVDPESKIIELKAEDILGNDDDDGDVGNLEDEEDVDSEDEGLNFEGSYYYKLSTLRQI